VKKLLLATRNRKKLIELQRILDGALGAHRIALLGLDDVETYPELPETGLTFGENALSKAREGGRRLRADRRRAERHAGRVQRPLGRAAR
jgi:XTP/dITP diphosphohydrolase